MGAGAGCKSACVRGCPWKRAWLELEAGWRAKEGSDPMAAAMEN